MTTMMAPGFTEVVVGAEDDLNELRTKWNLGLLMLLF